MNTCYFCKGPIEETRIDHMAQRRGQYVLVRDLMVERCTQCGEVYLDAAACRRVDAALSAAGGAAECLTVPIVQAR